MTSQEQLSTKSIVEMLFNFIIDNFDSFEHSPGRNGWWNNHNYGKERGLNGDSWAPFVEACFVLEGEKTSFTVGHCYGNDAHNVENFIDDYRTSMNEIEPPYNHSIHPCDSSSIGGGEGIDVSWRIKDEKYFLALEHSENRHPQAIDKNGESGFCSKFNNGEPENNAQLRGICDEIYKLKKKHSIYNIIVSRPHIRYKDNKIYQNVVDCFKKNIEGILLNVNPPDKWLIILIAPEFHVSNPIEETKIKFHCYEWQSNKLEKIQENEKYSFKVKTIKTNGDELVRICKPISLPS